MGKLIPFKRPERETLPRNENPRIANLNLFSQLTTSLKLVGVEIDQKLKIENYLNSVRGRISNHSLAELRKLLSSYSLKELNEMIKNSSEGNWASKPTFYRALIDELDSRNERLSQIPE